MEWDNKVSNRIVDGKLEERDIPCIQSPVMPNNVPSSSIIRFNEDGTAHLSVAQWILGETRHRINTNCSRSFTGSTRENSYYYRDTENTYECKTVASQ